MLNWALRWGANPPPKLPDRKKPVPAFTSCTFVVVVSTRELLRWWLPRTGAFFVAVAAALL